MDKINEGSSSLSHHHVEKSKSQNHKGTKTSKVAKEAMSKTEAHKTLKGLLNRAQKATGKTKEMGKKVELCAAHALKKKK